MKSETILETRGLEFSYLDGARALVGVDIAIPDGRKVAFIGPNGAGKTTLFLHFNGLMRPDRGQVYFAGQEVRYSHKALLELRKKVGIVFQDPDTQLFSASVRQEISFGPLNLGLPREEVLERVNRAMADTGILDLQDKPTHFLSYGQKKRVTIADILAMQPQVLICDEPTAWLDNKHAEQIMGLLSASNRGGTTVIISTHDVDLAYSWADYIFVMKDGGVIGEGAPGDVFGNSRLLAEAELEQPWLIDVCEGLAGQGWRLPVQPRCKQELLQALAQQAGTVLCRGSKDAGAWAVPVLMGAAGEQSGAIALGGRDSNDHTDHDGFRVAGETGPAGAGYRLQGGKMLRRGFTTGTCAAAAARAAVLALFGQAPVEVFVRLPGGGEAVLPVAGTDIDGDWARAWVIKDAGDDPDVTDGARIEASVRLRPEGIAIRGGPGVGTVTRPGLAVPPDQPAINPAPLQMIRENVAAVLPPGSGAEVVISVPEGERLARRTMNPRLGIVGGISILGTTGIVEPMSEEAFKQALTPQLDLARAAGQRIVVLTPGRRGASLAGEFGIPPEAAVLTSNFIGFMLEECVHRGLRQVLLWGHVGKLAKVAAGSFQTYNRIADGRAEVVAALAAARGAEAGLVRAILDAPTAEAMVGLLRDAGLEGVWHDLAARASSRATAYARDELQVGAVLFSYAGGPVGWDDSAMQLMQGAGWAITRARFPCERGDGSRAQV